MHDHSRFQRDIDDVTGVSLSLSLSQKSLTHNIGSASALPIIVTKRLTPKQATRQKTIKKKKEKLITSQESSSCVRLCVSFGFENIKIEMYI